MLTGLVLLVGGGLGGWMIFDGLHVLRHGKYYGSGRLGLWAALMTRLGVDPLGLGRVFVGLGAAWLVVTLLVVVGPTWSRVAALALGLATLWFVPWGAVGALLFLVLLAGLP
ncbi:MAG: hypothetical protein OEW12_02780 [Deltaproteobacteria bacterium]|nr:hypothetical protein [Deltaproteobacteria bacterium]